MVPSPVAHSNLPVPPINSNLPHMFVLSGGKLSVRSPTAKFSLHLIKRVLPIPSVRYPPDLPGIQSVTLQKHVSLSGNNLFHHPSLIRSVPSGKQDPSC